MSSKVRTGLLVILDGFGFNPNSEHNAIAHAETPTWDRLLCTYPHGLLDASEENVGLPTGFMGNSEVGHLNIGAGRIVYQDLGLINRAIENEKFFINPVLLDLISNIKLHKERTLHLIGLVSDGGVHSHINHLYALLQLAKREEVSNVVIHVITDGRDTPPTSGITFLEKLESYCEDLHVGQVVSVMGRFYAMDRDKRWDRTEKAYEMLVRNGSEEIFTKASDYIRSQYEKNITDEFLLPARSKNYKGIRDGDAILFFNFRADRARQLTSVFDQIDFPHFRRKNFPTLSGFTSFTRYDEKFRVPHAFERSKIANTLGEVISRRGWKQLRIAETEKYAHVTYFFNGGEEKTFDGEERILIPSPRDVKTYDLKPEMSAVEVTDHLLKELGKEMFTFVVVNFANPDMVGHTGNFGAVVKAVQTVDRCVGRVIEWVENHDAFALVTSDHGNCEMMQDSSGAPLTAHTTFPVPFVVVDPKRKKTVSVRSDGKLCDIAPTLLSVWNVELPKEMTGRSLIEST